MFFNNFKKYANNIALIDESGKQLTYNDLLLISEQVGKYLEKRSVAFIFCENSADCVSCYISCLANGVVPLLIDRKIDSELADTLIDRYKPQYFLLPNDMTERMNDGTSIFSVDTYSIVKLNNERYPINDELALLLTTSGSVGSPKLVRQSYKNIQSNAEAISTYLELDENERAITTLPMNYTYGLSIINSHICSGASIIMTKATVISKPFWDLLKVHEATSFGGVPFTYEMLKRIRFFKMDLPSLKTMTQSGSKMTDDLFREFAEYAKANGKRFVPMYGQTEATSRMSYLPPELVAEKIGSIGRAVPGGKLMLIDTNNNEIAETVATGELVYEGPNVTLGYAEKADDLIKGDERGGRLSTGDIARRDEDGCYYIVGRISRFLKLYGNRVNLDEIDRLVKSHFDIDCASVGTDSQCLTYITDETLTDEVERFLSAKTHLNPKAFRAVYINEIPKNPSGKVLFAKLPNV
ncbi:MAG: AMP-binding protein [Faecalibacterium sp.]|nr:AMP-binding protein [Ruminococcus sp.]MCM1392935.1 AMP-binding protein [Ruminococcus sp.]MCM1485375.1 AMP-binding protein [Faecalibacterium sp.]